MASGDPSSSSSGDSRRRKKLFGRIFRNKARDEKNDTTSDAPETPDQDPSDHDVDLSSSESESELEGDDENDSETDELPPDEPSSASDGIGALVEETAFDSEEDESVSSDEVPNKLPDPLSRGSAPYFSSDRQTEDQEDGADEALDAGNEGEKPKAKNPKKKSSLLRFLSRSRGPEPLEPKDESIADRRASELVVKFPNDTSSPSGNTPSEDKEKKPEKSLMSRAVRTITIMLAILFFSPLVTDEIEARFSPPPAASKIEREQDLDSIDSETSDATENTKEKNESPEEIQESMEEALKESLETTPTPSKSMPLDEKTKVALSFVTDVVNEVGPSVVRVDTETHMRDQSDSPQLPGYIQQGQGSGLIFSDKGFILTNAHVVEDATKVTVTLTDGRVYSCQVMGSDEIVDIAVLKIVGGNVGSTISNLPVAKLGDSDKISVGKIVIAVGSPGGLDNTVTMGIVSGLERSSTMVGIPHKKVDYIQTDAAINPGNSGGPLIDVESGQVIGINAAIRAHMEGTSFAIPINRVRDIMTDLADGREIHHGYLGLGLATCTPEWAKQNNADNNDGSPPIPEVYGAIVHRVFPRTPAENGGLKENDIILSIGDRKVKSAEDARRLIDLASVEKEMPVIVLRGQREVVLTVKPVDLAGRLREMRKERQRQIRQEQLRFQELGPFRSMVQ